MFELNYTPYTMENKDKFLSDCYSTIKFKGSFKKIKYANIPCSFDIETSSFYFDENGKKVKGACMYIWQLGINGRVLIGRYWKELVNVLDELSCDLMLNENKRIIFYVHNLAYEFQFIRKWFNWVSMFAKEERKPIYCVTSNYIEFRCSYILSAYSLEKVGEHLAKYPVKKLVGNLNYDLIRHNKTPLSNDEIAYCVNDVLVVMAYIQEYIERSNGSIANLPLTNTGVVRSFCRQKCIRREKKSVKNYDSYRRIMDGLTIDGETEYKQLKRCFQGGFTHSNAIKTGYVLDNVHSFDFTSSYPYVMLSEKFPMSKGKLVEIKSVKNLKKYMNLYCCIFDLVLYNINPILTFENPIPRAKCYICEGAIVNNGRIVTAKKIFITCTEVDFWIYKQFYRWDKAAIYNCRVYERDYLPTKFIKSILELYKKKTELKGVEEKEIEYLVSKQMLNSCYGMCVTDIVHDEITYEVEWNTETGNIEEQIAKYNTTKNRFLFYPWGVYVTAYARKNLFTGILECKDDYIYSDTDSIKFSNIDKHKKYFNLYNKDVLTKLKIAAEYHKINFEEFIPSNIKGEKKIIGIWEYEGEYKHFKTLGAKRYLTEQNNKIMMTVAGVNKQKAKQYLVDKYKNKIWDKFNNLMYIPKEHSGKLTHTYIDNELDTIIKDYKGEYLEVKEKSYIHLEKTDFTLSITSQYLDFLAGVKIVEE